jgi:hypothetical protein
MMFEAQLLRLLRDLQESIQKNPPLQDSVELVYDSPETLAFVTDDPQKLANALCSPSYRWSAYTEVKGGDVKIWHHYHWAPLDFSAEIWMYPKPSSISVNAYWEPEWTYVCDLNIQAFTHCSATVVAALLNGVLHKIVRVLPRPLQE